MYSSVKAGQKQYLCQILSAVCRYLLVTLTVLGTALTLMVNAYSQNERTNLLKENVQSVSGTISSSLIMQDINSRYSVEKS